MNIKKTALLVYLRLIKALLGLKIGALAPFKNLHYYLVTHFFKAYPVEVGGHGMFVHLHDSIISSRLLWKGTFEQSEAEFMKVRIRKGSTVLDIGANIGLHTLLFSELVGPAGKVFAFEPDPDNFALLKRNVDINGCKNVTLVPKALSDKNGFIRLFLAEDNKGDHRTWDPHNGRRHLDIEAITLDDYFGNYQGTIDFLKMDVQGAEGSVLRGGQSLFMKNPRMSGVFEFWPKGLKSAGTEPAEFLEFFTSRGYKLQDIDKREAEPVTAEGLLARYLPEPDGAREIFTNVFFKKSYDVTKI